MYDLKLHTSRVVRECVAGFKVLHLPSQQPFIFLFFMFALDGKKSNRLEFKEERLKGQAFKRVCKEKNSLPGEVV